MLKRQKILNALWFLMRTLFAPEFLYLPLVYLAVLQRGVRLNCGLELRPTSRSICKHFIININRHVIGIKSIMLCANKSNIVKSGQSASSLQLGLRLKQKTLKV